MKRNKIFTIMAAVAVLFALTLTQANADRVHFVYRGGRWSHSHHSGWNHYWGGPSIGFYWAPYPVYIVDGYSAPRYYTGSSFWYSNPSFGLSINIGGGGGRYYDGGPGYYYGGTRYYDGGGYRSRNYGRGDHWNNGGRRSHGNGGEGRGGGRGHDRR